MTVACIAFAGHCVLDHVFEVGALSAEPGKQVARGYAARPGGLATNAALAAQALRDPVRSPSVRLLSAVGDDDAGRWLHDALAARGLHDDVVVVPGARTSVSAVLVAPDGERQLHNLRGDALQRAALPPLPDGARALQVDPRWPAAALALLDEARRRGVTALLDAEVAETEVLRQLAPRAPWVVFSSAGLAAWAGDDAANTQEALARMARALPAAHRVVTRGAAGAWWQPPDGEACELPAFAVQALNTNGAGDTLHGALLLALAEGQPPRQALRFGMAAAALACTGQPLRRAEVLQMTAGGR